MTRSCCDNAVERCFHLCCDSSSPMQSKNGAFPSLFENENKTKHGGSKALRDVCLFTFTFYFTLLDSKCHLIHSEKASSPARDSGSRLVTGMLTVLNQHRDDLYYKGQSKLYRGDKEG